MTKNNENKADEPWYWNNVNAVIALGLIVAMLALCSWLAPDRPKKATVYQNDNLAIQCIEKKAGACERVRIKGLKMKLVTVDDFLTWHNNAGGFLRCPVIVQLDNDPPHERELSLYFFSRLEGGAKSGMYDYWLRDGTRKQDLDCSRMIVVGFRPVMVKDTGFFAELGIDASSGFIMLVKAHPIEVFEGEENDRK